MSRCSNAEPVSDSEDEHDGKGLATISTETVRLECPFCKEKFNTLDQFDYHVDTNHFSLQKVDFNAWKKQRKRKKLTLEALYKADSTAIALSKKPIKLVSLNQIRLK